MTSKGLRKDAEGIKSLSQRDIEDIEKGYTNIIFQKKKYSPYPRIYQTVWEYYMYSKTGDPSYQSFSQRLEFARAAITIIKENPWIGVGAGNWKEEFRKTFEKSNSKLDKKLYASSHNQYLNYMVKFGISGFLIIMFLLVYPVIRSKSYTDPVFLTFLVFMFAANFGDSNFETHMGSSFFLVFYCLFLLSKDQNYLLINK
jgi:O-antigen ligase